MDQIKKVFFQVRDLYLGMTPGNRIVAALLLATLVVSLGYLIVGSVAPGNVSASNTVRVFDGWRFDRNEMIAVEGVLAGEGLSDHRWIGNQLEVPKKLASKYTAAIEKGKAIRPRGNALTDTVSDFGPWESAKMLNSKERQARARVVEDSIAEMGGIVSAKVVPNERISYDKDIRARRTINSVTVYITPVGYKPLDDNTVTAIGNSVARAFGITDMNEISIVDQEGNRSYDGKGSEITGGGGDYLKQQARYQREWEEKIHRILPYIKGLQVQTSVDLTKDIQRYLEIQHDKPTILTEHVRGSEFYKQGYDRYGRPGMIAQFNHTLIDPAADIANQAKTSERKHEQEHTNALPGRETKGEVVPFTPLRIFATLQIPKNYVLACWLAGNARQGETPPEPTEDDLLEEEGRIRRQIRQAVSNLLKPYWDKKMTPDPMEMVQVEFYQTFDEPEVVMSTWDHVKIWLAQNWQTLSLMGLVLCGLGVLWVITKPAKPDPIVIYEAPEIPMEAIEARARAVAEAEAAAQAEEEEDEDFQRTLEGFDRSIRSLQEEIAELVEENPEAAAAVLRQWIGNAVLVENR